LEQDLLRAKAGIIPAQFMQLEADYNTRQQQQADGADAPATTSTANSKQQQQQQQAELQRQQQQQQQEEEDLAESDLDMPLITAALNWLGIKVMIPQEGKVRGTGVWEGPAPWTLTLNVWSHHMGSTTTLIPIA
jgi:hypothetical protein